MSINPTDYHVHPRSDRRVIAKPYRPLFPKLVPVPLGTTTARAWESYRAVHYNTKQADRKCMRLKAQRLQLGVTKSELDRMRRNAAIARMAA